MNKRFIKWQLKEWMPLLCAILIIFFFTMVVPGLIISTYREVWVDDVWTWSMNTPSLSRFVIAPMLFAFILPLFVLDYRFNKRKADIYYQLPLKEKELKNTRIVLALVALLVLFTITFFAGMLSTMAHQTSERNWIINAYPGTQLGLYNYGYFALFYLCLLFIISGEYFVSLFFANLGNNSNSAVMNAICGNTILFLLISSVFMFVRSCFISPENHFPDSLDTLLQFTFCLNLHPVSLAIHTTYSFTCAIKSGQFEMLVSAAYYIPFIILDVLVIILATVYMFHAKDPSGEYSGSFLARKEWMNYIIHITAFILSCFNIITVNFGIWIFIYATIYVVFEYLIICSSRKSFHLKKLDYILLGIQLVWFFVPFGIKAISYKIG